MDRRVQILDRQEIFHHFFRIDEVRLQYERFDGSMSDPVSRLIFDRGDSVAVLPHDPVKRSVLLCEQFRAPTYERGPGWLLEIPAGIVEPGERAEDCARRETEEEIGYSVGTLQWIATVYLSPGGSSERVHIFHAEVSMRDDTRTTGGVVSEGEDIRIISLPVDEAIAQARGGQILDAKTLIALQWLERPFSQR
jgi:nudix-type nucleoside diphosphatase (YffH/AdpP family)